MQSLVQLKSQPKVTCFGLRRKNQQHTSDPAPWSRNPTNEKPDDTPKASKALEGAVRPSPDSLSSDNSCYGQKILLPLLLSKEARVMAREAMGSGERYICFNHAGAFAEANDYLRSKGHSAILWHRLPYRDV